MIEWNDEKVNHLSFEAVLYHLKYGYFYAFIKVNKHQFTYKRVSPCIGLKQKNDAIHAADMVKKSSGGFSNRGTVD